MSARFVDTAIERPRWRFTANHRLHERLQAGLEWNPGAGEVGPLATLFLLTETEVRPALFLGTSSDRIGSPPGTQGYYGTLAKYLPGLRTSVHAGAHYSEWDRRVVVPFGASVELGRGLTLQPLHDGRRTHLLLNWVGDATSVSLIWAWFERPGAALSFGF